jgi:hypothetical protein
MLKCKNKQQNKYAKLFKDFQSYENNAHWQLPNRRYYINNQTSQNRVAFLVRFTHDVRETSPFFYLNYIQDILIQLSTTMVPTTATDVDRYKFLFINGIGLQCVVIIRKFCRKCMSCTQWRTSCFLLKRIYMTIKE